MASISLPILRELGLNGLKKNIFPCVSHQHYAISNFFFKIYFSTSYVLHRTFSPIITVLTETSTQVFQSILYIVSKVLGPFCQKSKFTGLYELRLIPKVLEKWISDYLIHPVYTLDLKKSFIQHKKEGFLKKINQIFDRISKSNPQLIPSKEQNGYNYSFEVFDSDNYHAYSLPAGKILLSSKLLKELSEAIKSKEIKETRVELKDGSIVKVDLSSCQVDDVLSAIIGHEMTHVEASHSVQEMGYHLFSAFLKYVLELLHPQKGAIPSMYLPLVSEIFMGIYHLFHALFFKRHSRTFEYTCDISALYMQNQAEFNLLGSLYLQEFLSQLCSKKELLLMKYFEFMHSHPSFEKRKTALIYCIEKLAPSLVQHFKIEKESSVYDKHKEANGIFLAKGLIERIKQKHELLAVFHGQAERNFAI